MSDKKEFFDERAEDWDVISVHDMDIVTMLADRLGLEGDDSVLDIGTGTGVMIPFYRKRTEGKIVALDYSEKMVEVAKRKFPPEEYGVEYVVSDLYDYNPDVLFDAIVCYSCFPHFPRKAEAVSHLASMLKDDGLLMIAHGCSREHINEVHKNAGHEVEMDHLPDLDTITGMMESAGLEVVWVVDDDKCYSIMGRKSP